MRIRVTVGGQVYRFTSTFILLCSLCAIGTAFADDPPIVFRSDVALVRVDAQVLDRDSRAVTGLTADDFVLRVNGQPQPIRNFANENMPVDVLFLFDVSASMRPHVQKIANAAHDAFRVLGSKDRVGIMVFDRYSRVRMPFKADRSEIEQGLQRMLRDENFRGGTDITLGLLDAADYIRTEARRDARRAIVVLTDDQTQMDRDDEKVGRALSRADAILFALIAPDAMAGRGGMGRGRRGGGYPGGGYPGGGYPGGGIGGPLGGIILGRRGPYGGYPGGGGGYPGGGRYPNGGGGYGHETKSAGTAEIARASGGDSTPVDDASALETTLSRIRQRYALHFNLPETAKPGQTLTIEVDLARNALIMHSDAELRYRRTYAVPGADGRGGSSGTLETRKHAGWSDSGDDSSSAESGPTMRRRRAVDDSGSSSERPSIAAPPPSSSPSSSGPSVARPPAPDSSAGGNTAAAASATTDAQTDDPPKTHRGWRRADDSTGPSNGPLPPADSSK